MMSVAEDEGTVQVCAILSLSTEVDIALTLTTSDGTGTYVSKLKCSSFNGCFCS